MKKATAVALCALAALCASGAMKWKNFDDKSHLSGPKLTEDDLLGKAVLLYYWDAADEASVKYLPEVEKVWNSFKTKKFAVIGTYGGAKDEAKIKAAVEKANITPDMDISAICEAMKTAMTEIQIDGLTGTITWTADGEPDKDPKAVQIESGVYVSMQ